MDQEAKMKFKTNKGFQMEGRVGGKIYKNRL